MTIELSLSFLCETDTPAFEVEVDGRKFGNRMPVIGTTALVRVPNKDCSRIFVRQAQRIIKHCRRKFPETNRVSIHIEDSSQTEPIVIMAED